MKHQDLLNKLTLEEKAALLGGKGEWQTWDIPSPPTWRRAYFASG